MNRLTYHNVDYMNEIIDVVVKSMKDDGNILISLIDVVNEILEHVRN